MGISKDKEAYEQLEAWGKHGASNATRAGRGAQMAEMDAAQERVGEVEQGEKRAGQPVAAHARARAHFLHRLSVK